MSYRARSSDVWHSLPGVIAACQPIAAPDSLAARQNVAHGGARFGVYNPTPGVLPTWSAPAGWGFGGSEYLDINLSPPLTGWSFLIRYSDHAGGALFGCSTYDLGSVFSARPGYFGSMSYRHGYGFLTVGAYESRGVMGVIGDRGAINGETPAGSIAGYGAGDAYYSPIIGGVRTFVVDQLATCKMQAFLLCSTILSPAEVYFASRQMAYCEQNPDWNVWARRRRYFYAPLPPPPSEDRSVRAALGGSFGAQLSNPPFGSHSGPRRPTGPIGGHRGKLNA